MTVRALLVDLDGTLVDTAPANYRAYAEALAGCGVKVTREAFDAVALGRNWRQFLPALLEDRAGEAEAVAARKAELYPAFLGESLLNRPLAGLIAAGRPGCQTALVTTASAANAAAVLRHHRLENLFDTVVTGSDVACHKPDPEAYRLAADRLAIPPADCLVFEDSPIGLAAANAFGAPAIRIRFPTA